MTAFDFATPQETLAQVQAAGRKALEASQKLFTAQCELVQENTRAAFGLAQSALDVRDVDGFKAFAADATRATREAFERTSQFVQSLASQQVEAAQDLGKSAARKR